MCEQETVDLHGAVTPSLTVEPDLRANLIAKQEHEREARIALADGRELEPTLDLSLVASSPRPLNPAELLRELEALQELERRVDRALAVA